MNMQILLLILVGLTGVAAMVFGWAGWRAALAAPERLQLGLEKVLAASRAEAEFLRASLAAMEGRLAGAIQTGTTEALSKAFAQISGATQNMANALGASIALNVNNPDRPKPLSTTAFSPPGSSSVPAA